jgi:phosphate transport system permease protein
MTDTLLTPLPSRGVTLSLREVDAHTRRRKRRSALMRYLLLLGMGVAILPLVLILVVVFQRGMPAMGIEFLTEIQPSGRTTGGGYLHGIVGTFYMVGIATVLSVPIGILAAIYLTEYGTGPLAGTIRFFTDVMTGVPSVFVGLFIYSLLIRQVGFGSLVGGFGLAVLMLPIVVRSSEEMLRLVPEDQKAASAGLGARKWQTITKVVLPTAAPGLVTGSMLAVARALGETAVLLLTALGSLRVVTALQGEPQSAVTLLIYRGARQPFEAGQERAWAGALFLLVLVLILTFFARWISTRGRLRRS